MLFELLAGGDLQSIVISLLLSLPIIAFALSLHETAHGYVAYRCGDSTAYNLGRLTLNPLRHLDPMGLIAMLVFGFGWAKPVPINPRNFRDPKRGMALSAAAGPVANLLLGIFSALFYGFSLALYNYLYWVGAASATLTAVMWITMLAELGALYNFTFAVFNMIPVPPFDGSRVLYAFLPPKQYFGVMRYERQIMLGILILLLVLSRLGFSPLSFVTNWMTERIAAPVFRLFINIFSKLV